MGNWTVKESVTVFLIFLSNNCSLGEQKSLLLKRFKKSYRYTYVFLKVYNEKPVYTIYNALIQCYNDLIVDPKIQIQSFILYLYSLLSSAEDKRRHC